MEKSTVILNIDNKIIKDIEIPLNISAIELLYGLNSAFSLGMDIKKINEYSISTENPICLLKGTRILKSYNIHNGSRLYIRSDI